MLTLLITACGQSEIDDDKIIPIEEKDNQKEPINTEAPPEEEQIDLDIYNPGVKDIITKARLLTRWHYKNDFSDRE